MGTLLWRRKQNRVHVCHLVSAGEFTLLPVIPVLVVQVDAGGDLEEVISWLGLMEELRDTQALFKSQLTTSALDWDQHMAPLSAPGDQGNPSCKVWSSRLSSLCSSWEATAPWKNESSFPAWCLSARAGYWGGRGTGKCRNVLTPLRIQGHG